MTMKHPKKVMAQQGMICFTKQMKDELSQGCTIWTVDRIVLQLGSSFDVDFWKADTWFLSTFFLLIFFETFSYKLRCVAFLSFTEMCE